MIIKSNDPRSYRLHSRKILRLGYKNQKNVKIAIDELLKFFHKTNFKISTRNINLEVIRNLKVN